MRRRIVSVLVLSLMATGVVSVPAMAAPAVDQVSPLAGVGGSAWIGSNFPTAQPFVPQVTGSLTSVSIPLARNVYGASYTNFTVSVYATSEGIPTGQPLASVVFGQSDVNALTQDRANPPSTVNAVFTNPANVTAGTVYALRVTTTDTGDVFHWFSGNYCLGHIYQRASSNGRWLSGDGALAFTTYVDGTPDASSGIPKPAGVRGAPGGSSATLTFGTCSGSGAPNDYGITNYEYSLNGGTNWQALSPADTTSPVTVPGLTNGVAATIKLRAVTSSGTGPASDSVTVTPVAQLPFSPENPSALNVPGGAWISFTDGGGNGSPVIRYEYELDFNGEWFPTEPGTSSPVLVTGLANGVSRYLRLRTVNEAGASGPSYYETVVTPGIPDAPVGLVATPVAGGVSVAYTPCYEGVSSITDIEYDTGAGWATSDTSSIWEPVVISGLTDGTPVQVKLRLANSAAASYESETLTVTPGAGQLVVSGSTTTCSRPGPTRPVSTPPSSSGSGSGAPQSSVQVVSQQPVITSSGQASSATGSSSASTTSTAPAAPAPVVRVTKPVGDTPAEAPVVRASVSEPIKIKVIGVPASKRLSVQVWVNGRWRGVGNVRSGPAGGTTTPAITAQEPGALLVRIGSASAGWSFVRIMAD